MSEKKMVSKHLKLRRDQIATIDKSSANRAATFNQVVRDCIDFYFSVLHMRSGKKVDFPFLRAELEKVEGHPNERRFQIPRGPEEYPAP